MASWLVPGVGTIFAIGLGAAAVLGLGGAVAGAKAGEVMEHKLDIGVPKDDVFFYRELLRRGRSLVIVNLQSDDLGPAARDAIEEQGGEDVAAALLAAIDAPRVVGRSYNLVGDVRLTAREYVEALASEMPVSLASESTVRSHWASSSRNSMRTGLASALPRWAKCP